MRITNAEKLVAKFGPLKRIWRNREKELLKEGKYLYILTVMTDGHFTERLFAEVGHHCVNVEMIYETAKPMPKDLRLTSRGIWFGGKALPCDGKERP